MPQLPETPQLTPTVLAKNALEPKKFMTFGDLYTQIQSGSLLTPEQEIVLKERITEKYGFNLLGKRKELVTESTRNELEELLADMPGKSDILAKLDGLLPGRSKTTKVVDNALDLGKKGIDGAKILTPAILTETLNSTLEGAKAGIGKSGTHVLGAVGEIVSANSIDGATGGMNKLSKAIDAVSVTFSSAMKGFGDILSSILSIMGLDKLWGSIKGLFGMKSEEKKEASAQKKIDDGLINIKTQGEKASDAILDPKKTKELIANLSQGLGDKISEKYFGGQKLSGTQMQKINSILTNSFDPESLQKIAKRYQKDGLAINLGELTEAIWEVGGAFPARVMWDLSWSGIIPLWAITQHVVINPAKNMIALTLDGLGFPVSTISLSDWNSKLEEKSKNGDTHALDMARIQLYGINSVLWRTMGSVLGTAAAAGIMITDTTTKTDGLKMAQMSTLKEYNALAGEFQKIESTLARGSVNEKSAGLFTQMMDGITGIRANSFLLDTVAKNTVNGVMDAKNIIDAIAKNPELNLYHGQLDSLKLLTEPKSANIFRDAVKKMAFQQSSTSGLGQDLAREWSKYTGGQNGAIVQHLERINRVKSSQIELLGNSGLAEKWNRMKLSWQSLKMARSGDTVNLHLETAEDVSKFRAFLSVIPGGIKAIAEIIPAASLVVSLSSVVFAGKDEKESTGESLMDIFKTALIPAYGTFGIIKSKTVDFGKMIEEGKMPEFSDIALTGVVGGVFMYEVTRVASGLIDMKNGNMTKGLSKLTYMHDIGRGMGQMIRGTRNIAALAKTPVANTAMTKTLTSLATKIPKTGKLAIAAAALLATGGAYAYISGLEKPEDIMKNFHKEGWLDIGNNPTSKMKEVFHSKTPAEKSGILDELLIMHLGITKNLPKTHFDETVGKYSLICEGNSMVNSMIDGPFRTTLQSLGVDIDLQKA